MGALYRGFLAGDGEGYGTGLSSFTCVSTSAIGGLKLLFTVAAILVALYRLREQGYIVISS